MAIDMADYQHGWLPAWILLYIVIFLQDTSIDDHQHGELSARMTIFMDGYLQNIDRSIDTSC